MNKLLAFPEKIFVLFSLLHYTGGPLNLIVTGGINEGEETAIQSDSGLVLVFFVINYCVSFFLLAIRWKKGIGFLNKNIFIWILLLLAGFSIFWSTSPDTTMRRVIALLGTSLFGYYLATRYSLKELLQLLAWTFGIAIFLSILTVVVLPKYGVMAGIHAGLWRGIYPHKNILGKIMVISANTFLLLAMDNKRHSLILWGGFFLSVILLLLSKSTTSLITLITLLGVIPIFRTLRWRYDMMIPALLFIAIVGSSFSIWFMDNAASLPGLLGKDTTLTGRADLWPILFDKIGQHPLLGYGYGAFWNDWNSEGADVWYAVGWMPPHAHNGWIDILLDLGFVGATIFIISFCQALVNALAWLRSSETFASLFPLQQMLYMIVSNLGESRLFRHHDLIWVLFMAVSVLIVKPSASLRQ